jgi:hypothetical protein
MVVSIASFVGVGSELIERQGRAGGRLSHRRNRKGGQRKGCDSRNLPSFTERERKIYRSTIIDLVAYSYHSAIFQTFLKEDRRPPPSSERRFRPTIIVLFRIHAANTIAPKTIESFTSIIISPDRFTVPFVLPHPRAASLGDRQRPCPLRWRFVRWRRQYGL